MLRSRSSVVRTCSLSLPAKTEIGRVCGTSDIIEPSATNPVMSSRSATSTNSLANACQARAGSTPVSSHSWVLRVGFTGLRIVASGHFSSRLPSPSIAICGPRVLVVEVQLGVDREDGLVRADLAQMRDGGGRRLAGVVPPVERGHEHLASQSVHATSSARICGVPPG